MAYKYLLGATKDNEIVFTEFGITKLNGYPEFTACFDTVRPFTADSLEEPIDYYEQLLQDCYSDADKYKMCERYDCSPSELAENMADDNGTDPMDMRDCSFYPVCLNVDGTEWYFESASGGQHDTRNEMEIYTDKDAYDQIHLLWDKYHLKAVDKIIIEYVAILQNALSNIDTEKWISNYIRNTM